jgi:hypothetical protein
MAISWYVVEAHEQAYWSVAGSSLRAAMPAGSSLRDLRVRGAVSRVEALARPADRVEMLDALDRVVNRTAGRSRYGEYTPGRSF